MIFLLILILTTILVFLLFSNGTTTEAFGNEILDIPSGTYGVSGNQGQSGNPPVPMDPGAGYYAINVGTIDAPIWKRKSVPYGYKRDPTDFTKLIGRTESTIQGSTGGLTDADALAPPFLNIPGATYTGDTPDYGAGIKPPASGFYKIQVYKKMDPQPTLSGKKNIWRKYDYTDGKRYFVFYNDDNSNEINKNKVYTVSTSGVNTRVTDAVTQDNIYNHKGSNRSKLEGEFTIGSTRYYFKKDVATGPEIFYNIVYYQKTLPNEYVADRKDMFVDRVNPGTINYDTDPTNNFLETTKKYTKLVYRAPEVPETTMMITSGLSNISEAAIQSDPAWDGYYIINSAGIYYKKLIPNGYDIDSRNPPQTEYKRLPEPGKHTPLKYNPNFTPEKYSMTDISYNARDTDRVYRDPTAGKTDDPNLGKYWMFDDEGKLIEVNTESNKSPILYYVPGAYKFGASNYVPNYEDSVYLSRTTRESQLAPVINTASQLGGFCTQYAGNTTKIEEKCAAQDLNACASTSCCVLLGGQKCVAGSENGPKNVANYTDYNLMNRDFYYYQGKCYGNCA
jgi:hypothetical protein